METLTTQLPMTLNSGNTRNLKSYSPQRAQQRLVAPSQFDIFLLVFVKIFNEFHFSISKGIQCVVWKVILLLDPSKLKQVCHTFDSSFLVENCYAYTRRYVLQVRNYLKIAGNMVLIIRVQVAIFQQKLHQIMQELAR